MFSRAGEIASLFAVRYVQTPAIAFHRYAMAREHGGARMFEWLKGSKLKNCVGLSEEWCSLLAEDLLLLDKARSGLGRKALRFVLDDEGMEVLTELRGAADIEKHFQLSFVYMTNREKFRKQFFNKVVVDDPGFYYRLARVYEACLRKSAHFIAASTNFENDRLWAKVLLYEICPDGGYSYGNRSTEPYFDFRMMERVLEHGGIPSDLLVREVLLGNRQRYMTMNVSYICNLRGFGLAVHGQAALVSQILRQKTTENKINLLDVFKKYRVNVTPFVDELVACAVSSSKRVRAAVLALPVFGEPGSMELLEGFATKGTTDEKVQAVTLLSRYFKDESRDFVNALLESSKNEKLLKAIKAQTGILEKASDRTGDKPTLTDVPVMQKSDPYQPLTRDAKNAFAGFVEDANRELERYYRNLRNSPYFKGRIEEVYIGQDDEKRMIENMERLVVSGSHYQAQTKFTVHVAAGKLYALFARQDTSLVHAIRLAVSLYGIDLENRNRGQALYWLLANTREYQRKKKFTLLDLSSALDAMGIDPVHIGTAYMGAFKYAWQYGPFSRMADDAIWPYFHSHLDLIDEGLGLVPASRLKQENDFMHAEFKLNALTALSAFPVIPERFEPVLWETAMEGSQKERPLAMKCLEKIPGFCDTLADYLESGNQEIRIRAAAWLEDTGNKEAIPDLEAALSREKQERVRAALMEALERLGKPIADFFDREGLLSDAKKELAKGIPEKMSWYPWDSLPPLRWKDSGEIVPEDIVKWFIIRAFRLNNPEPDPALRVYCSFFDEACASALGMHVLASWIHRDTLPRYTHDEAVVEAKKNTAQTKAAVARYAQYYKNWDENAYFKSTLNHLENECLDSATEFKGILSVTAACNSTDAVKPAHDYIKHWYGQRSAQAKALIRMLAWLDRPIAAQVVLSIGRRFRTKGIQEEAAKQIELLARRRGWTPDELADRTVPTAGLDERGEMTLSYGPRSFVARLDDVHLKLIVYREDGAQIKSLPDPAQADDAELAKEAKKALLASSKELKQVLGLQKERLYDAMCIGRRWKFSDWSEYLASHPILGCLCRMLVWGVFKNDALALTFRPMQDSTLTDAENNPVSLKDEDMVGLAHDCYVSEAVKKSWNTHFEDYRIAPLFTQFGKELYTLDESGKEKTAISDYRGWLVESFTLRNVLTKLGYVRGRAEDGGWFMTYVKNFPTLRLRAIIEFSGNSLPEESRTTALHGLSFFRSADESEYEDLLSLAEVPAVLLSECWNDMKAAADAGIGFDEQWEKKTGL